MTRGSFLVLEGGESVGKSTQVARLAARLRALGREVVETFEPGATALGARLRAVLLDGSDPVDPVAEALLLAADRAQHVSEVVRPALERGADVVSDRYLPSSLAYQGRARGLGVEEIERVNRWATGGLEPDLVVVLDVPEEVSRARQTGEPDRLERAGTEFHATVRAAYHELAEARGWVVVDATADPDAVGDAVWEAVSRCLSPTARGGPGPSGPDDARGVHR
ncbi:MAG: dTMP kinase [Acidimicrobiia bacterium]|nr:dTMP kinase [Acidimicrobiia bacterium]